jgi:hypothetical protein
MLTLPVHKSWNPWPISIIAFFAIAISGCVGFVAFCNLHPADLVAADYYEQEVRYQRQIDRVEHGREIGPLTAVTYIPLKRMISVSLPPAPISGELKGEIRLYRPSSAKLDRTIKLALGPDGRQEIDVSTMTAGLWKINVFWSADGKEYFIDREVHL